MKGAAFCRGVYSDFRTYSLCLYDFGGLEFLRGKECLFHLWSKIDCAVQAALDLCYSVRLDDGSKVYMAFGRHP